MRVVNAADQFIDTNVLLYLLSDDVQKADIAEQVLAKGGVISVQVLNEFAAVATRKLKLPIAEIRELLGTIRAVCKVVSITEATHDKGLEIVERYSMSLYDAMIVASALLADCKLLISEDMQHGQKIAGTLKTHNPFRTVEN